MSVRNVATQDELDAAIVAGDDIEITRDGLPLHAVFTSGGPRMLLQGGGALRLITLNEAHPVFDVRGYCRPMVIVRGQSKPTIIASEHAGPEVRVEDDAEPTLVTRAMTRVKLLADGRARPRVEAREMSRACVIAGLEARPSVQAWNGANVMITFSGDGSATAVAHDYSRIVITRPNKRAEVFTAQGATN